MAKYETTPFTNISKSTIFHGRYDSEEYEIKPMETKYFPTFIVEIFTRQWLGWATNTDEFGIRKKDGTYDKERFISEKKGKLEAQLTSKEYKIISLTTKEKTPEEVFKCETCGKEFSSKIGLEGHKRSHK